MRICYLSDAGSVHTKKWCSFFKHLGYEIHVISLNDGHIPGVVVHSLNIKLEDVKSKYLFNKLRYFKFISKVKELVKEINPDIVHAQYATSYGYLGKVTNFHPYIISVWGSDVYDFPKNNVVCKRFLKNNLAKADRILSTSKVMAEETKKYTNKSIEITPFGVDTNVFVPFEDRYDNRDNIVIGTVKTLEKKYGIEYLIRAFGNLTKKHNNIILEIAGLGSQKEYLYNLCKELGIEEKVEFLGFIDQKKVIEAFNRFDIVVFPSTLDSESFGVAAVEAQACGAATIVSNVGGLPEATSPNQSSIIVTKENITELEEAIEKLILNKDLRISMGKYGRKFVLENYELKDNFEKVDKIYKDIVKEKHSK